MTTDSLLEHTRMGSTPQKKSRYSNNMQLNFQTMGGKRKKSIKWSSMHFQMHDYDQLLIWFPLTI